MSAHPIPKRSRSRSFSQWISNAVNSGSNKQYIDVVNRVDTSAVPISQLKEGGIEFEVKYFGSVAVDQAKGQEMAISAARKIIMDRIDSQKRHMIMNVSLDGIKLTDVKKKIMIEFHKIHRISQCCRDKNNKKNVSYVAYDIERSSYYFHMFSLPTKDGGEDRARQLVAAIGASFKEVFKLHQEEEARKKAKEKPAESIPEEEPVKEVNPLDAAEQISAKEVQNVKGSPANSFGALIVLEDDEQRSTRPNSCTDATGTRPNSCTDATGTRPNSSTDATDIDDMFTNLARQRSPSLSLQTQSVTTLNTFCSSNAMEQTQQPWTAEVPKRDAFGMISTNNQF